MSDKDEDEDLSKIGKMEGLIKEYFPIWRWMVVMIVIGLVISLIGYFVNSSTGDIILFIGVVFSMTSFIGCVFGLALGYSLGWLIPLILGLFIGVYSGNYIAGAPGAVLGSYTGPIFGAVIGWVFSRMKIAHKKGLEYEYIKQKGKLLGIFD